MDQVALSSEQVDPSGQNDKVRPDDLKEAVRTILQVHHLPAHEPAHDNAVEYVVETVICARWCASERLERPKMPKRVASKLRNAANTRLKIAAAHGLASPTELKELQRLQRLAEADILRPRSSPGPQIRPWLWYWCLEFLGIWRRLTTRPAGVWMTDSDAQSPALAFLVSCCRLVDPQVNASAILRAKKKAGPASPPLWELSHEDFTMQQVTTQALYETLWQSEWLQKLHEPDL